MSFLSGLGSLAGGFQQGVSPYWQAQYAQQLQQNNPANAALGGAAMGVNPQQQQGMGGLGGIIQHLFGGGAQPSTAQPAAMPAYTPSDAGMGAVSAPPSPVQGTQVAQNSPPPQQGNTPLGDKFAPPLQQPMAQPAQARDALAQPGAGAQPSLLQRLAQQPGMTPQKMGVIIQSPGFQRMMAEEQRQQQMGATVRHQQALEEEASQRLTEQGRHNRVTEGQGGERIQNTEEARIAAAAKAAHSENLRATGQAETAARDQVKAADAVVNTARTELDRVRSALMQAKTSLADWPTKEKDIKALEGELNTRKLSVAAAEDKRDKMSQGLGAKPAAAADDELARAHKAIVAGAPIAKVREMYKKRTGKDLPMADAPAEAAPAEEPQQPEPPQEPEQPAAADAQ